MASVAGVWVMVWCEEEGGVDGTSEEGWEVASTVWDDDR